jgi:hypothetical protein
MACTSRSRDCRTSTARTRFALAGAVVVLAGAVGFLATRGLTDSRPGITSVSDPRAALVCDRETATARIPATDIRWAPTGNAYAVTRVVGPLPLGLDPWPRTENLRIAIARVGVSPHELGSGSQPVWSPDGRFIAFERPEEALHYTVVDVATSVAVLDVYPTLRAIGWRNGAVLYWTGHDLHAAKPGSDQVIAQASFPASDRYPAVEAGFSVDGEKFVVVRYEPSGAIAEALVGSVADGTTTSLGRVLGAGWSSVGQRLLLTRGASYELVAGADAYQIAAETLAGPFLEWSNDGWPLFAPIGSIRGEPPSQDLQRWNGVDLRTYAHVVFDPPRPGRVDAAGHYFAAIIRANAITELRIYECS